MSTFTDMIGPALDVPKRRSHLFHIERGRAKLSS